MQKLTVPVETVAVTFKDDATFYLPFRSYRREAIPLEEKHGEVVSVSYLPENATELDMILRRERFKTSFHAKTGSIEDHIHKLAVQHGVTEKLGILPLEAQTAYNAVKEAHPEAIVCFAQNLSLIHILGISVGDTVMLHCGDPIQYTSINTSYWQSHFYAFGRPNY